MSMPELSPLVAANLVCPDCGQTIKPKPVIGKRGAKEIVTHLEYRHQNEARGCNYVMESTVRTPLEMFPVRVDGTLVKIGR